MQDQCIVVNILYHLSSDQIALSEVEYHSELQHPNILECLQSDLVGAPDMIGSKTSQVLLLLPLCSVSNVDYYLQR